MEDGVPRLRRLPAGARRSRQDLPQGADGLAGPSIRKRQEAGGAHLVAAQQRGGVPRHNRPRLQVGRPVAHGVLALIRRPMRAVGGRGVAPRKFPPATAGAVHGAQRGRLLLLSLWRKEANPHVH